MSVEADRWKRIRKIQINWADMRRIFGGVVLVLLGVWIGGVLFADDSGYITNLYTELISIAITVFILDFLNRGRDEAHRIQELKDRLLRDIRSPEDSVAKQAVHELREYGWLWGETGVLRKANLLAANLQGAYLWGANLQGAYLWGANLQEAILGAANLEEVASMFANLQGANLRGANLQEAILGAANLQGAYLEAANLQGAKLGGANLQGAYLRGAEFQGVDLRGANLEGADLQYSNLQGADLAGAEFDEKTCLPDGSYWKPDVDLTRFTDPNHPQFWRSEGEYSSAYRYRKEDE